MGNGYPTTWEDRCRVCMHGVTEGVDRHTCSECRRIAEAVGLEWIDGIKTYIYFSLPEELKDNPEFSRVRV